MRGELGKSSSSALKSSDTLASYEPDRRREHRPSFMMRSLTPAVNNRAPTTSCTTAASKPQALTPGIPLRGWDTRFPCRRIVIEISVDRRWMVYKYPLVTGLGAREGL
jgi:hypothetical protein